MAELCVQALATSRFKFHSSVVSIWKLPAYIQVAHPSVYRILSVAYCAEISYYIPNLAALIQEYNVHLK